MNGWRGEEVAGGGGGNLGTHVKFPLPHKLPLESVGNRSLSGSPEANPAEQEIRHHSNSNNDNNINSHS